MKLIKKLVLYKYYFLNFFITNFFLELYQIAMAGKWLALAFLNLGEADIANVGKDLRVFNTGLCMRIGEGEGFRTDAPGFFSASNGMHGLFFIPFV